MSALKPVRRQFTARQAAERLGVTTRTVQRLMAEPRDQYLARANTKRVICTWFSSGDAGLLKNHEISQGQ